jgi:hypothetical protein
MAQNKNKSGSSVGFDEQFDSRLINSGSSSDKAGSLNEAKRQGSDIQTDSQNEPQTLREAVIAKKREEVKKEQEGESGPAAAAAVPMQKGTSKLLQDAWINLIPSWGLTLIWINIHVFLSLVIGKKFFCRLGDEWLTGGISGGAKSINAISQGKSGRITIKNGSQCANIGESMVLVVLDLILLILIIAIIAIIAGILKVVENPLDFLSSIIGWIWNSGGVSSI